jgi:sporulation protein YlmC with PRC-barrel domain
MNFHRRHIMRHALLSTALPTAALLLALSVPALAQQQTPSSGAISPVPDLSREHTTEGPVATAAEAERLIGTKAVTAQGSDVGTIENLLVNPDNTIERVVLEWGGVLGLGERHVAVPWEDVTMTADGRQAVIDLTRDQLENMQRYDPDVPAAAGIDPEAKPLR